MKKRLLSGITSTGNLTIGNYLGVIKNFVKLQNKYELLIFVADLHALTTDISRETLQKNRKKIYALYLACGLDPAKTTLFFQSDIAEHSQLNWIMESITTIGELERMIQFKDKSLKSKEANGTVKIKTTLLTYPTLMASDILLYNPDEVPVGSDQKQHVELTRNIAQRFNNQYGKTFKIPSFRTNKVTSKIMSLQEPTKKMSKSDNNQKASIFLLDDPNEAFNKIKKAKTDSEGKIYLSKDKPGITNLLTIYAGLKDIELKKVENHFKDKDYRTLKLEIGEEVKNLLTKIQHEYYLVLKKVDWYAKDGADKARKIANQTIKNVYKKIGLS